MNNAAFSIGERTLIQLISREATFAVRSIYSELPVERSQYINRAIVIGWQSRSGRVAGDLGIDVDATTRALKGFSPYRWILNRHGFEIGGVVDEEYPLSVFIVRAPYWSIVLPLPLLSVWLLLSKPRKPEADSLS